MIISAAVYTQLAWLPTVQITLSSWIMMIPKGYRVMGLDEHAFSWRHDFHTIFRQRLFRLLFRVQAYGPLSVGLSDQGNDPTMLRLVRKAIGKTDGMILWNLKVSPLLGFDPRRLLEFCCTIHHRCDDCNSELNLRVVIVPSCPSALSSFVVGTLLISLDLLVPCGKLEEVQGSLKRWICSFF